MALRIEIPGILKTAFGKLHSLLQLVFVRFLLQKVLATGALAFVYFVVLGATAIFFRSRLAIQALGRKKDQESNWVPAAGYEIDLETSQRQS